MNNNIKVYIEQYFNSIDIKSELKDIVMKRLSDIDYTEQMLEIWKL